MEDKPDIVCGDCGTAWKDTAKKCWMRGRRSQCPRQRCGTASSSPLMAKVAPGPGEWRSDLGTRRCGHEQRPRQARPGTTTMCTEGDMDELTMADRISMQQRVLENRPDQEAADSTVKARARTTDDLDPKQAFDLWHPEHEKADRLQARILASRGPQATQGPPGSTCLDPAAFEVQLWRRLDLDGGALELRASSASRARCGRRWRRFGSFQCCWRENGTPRACWSSMCSWALPALCAL